MEINTYVHWCIKYMDNGNINTIGTGLDVKYTFLTSATQPRLRGYTWRLSGTHGEWLESNHRQIPYGAALHNELLVVDFYWQHQNVWWFVRWIGNFMINIQLQYFLQIKLYPNSDANETLIDRSTLHEMIVSTDSENCNLKLYV